MQPKFSDMIEAALHNVRTRAASQPAEEPPRQPDEAGNEAVVGATGDETRTDQGPANPSELTVPPTRAKDC